MLSLGGRTNHVVLHCWSSYWHDSDCVFRQRRACWIHSAVFNRLPNTGPSFLCCVGFSRVWNNFLAHRDLLVLELNSQLYRRLPRHLIFSRKQSGSICRPNRQCNPHLCRYPQRLLLQPKRKRQRRWKAMSLCFQRICAEPKTMCPRRRPRTISSAHLYSQKHLNPPRLAVRASPTCAARF